MSMLLITHIITFTKVASCLSVAIRTNDTYPQNVSVGTMICMVFCVQTIKSIEPDYNKAMIMFSSYWGIYILSLSVYYWDFDLKQSLMYAGLFGLVYEIFRQNYELSNSAIEMSYDLHEDATIIYQKGERVKVNERFKQIFETATNFKYADHYTQILKYVEKPEELSFKFLDDDKTESITLDVLLRENKKYNGSALVTEINGEERVFSFSAFDLVNIYSCRTICIFKETTLLFKLEKEKSANKYKSVLLGCLTHELRTPVN